jgi:hypothetical protein
VNRALGIRSAISVGLVGLLAGVLLTAYAKAESWTSAESFGPSDLLGTSLPQVTVRSIDGSAAPLAERLARGPTMIIVLGPKDCFSCESYRLELNILKSRLPGITPILIGSGSDEKVFRDYFRGDHLESIGLLDPEQRLLKSLRIKSAPLVLLVDSARRILFVDNRSSSAAAQFPFGRLLPLLGGALQPVPPSPSKTGEPN